MLKTERNSIYLSSHFQDLQNLRIQTVLGLDPSQIKKLARKEISLQFSSEKHGFLHAVLIEFNGKYYAIAGHSGVGKTTYGKHLTDDRKFLAHDWIVVEKSGTDFFASDLNFSENLQGQKVKLDGVIFLTSNETHNRDAYYPSDSELITLLDETFDTANTQETKVLSNFWIQNCSYLPLCCCVPARGKNVKYIEDSIRKLISLHNKSMNNLAVGVIGLGNLGTQIASQIGQAGYINRINLHNRTHSASVGLALDMNHAHAENDELYVANKNMLDVFQNSDVVFLTFRDQSGKELENVPERWRKIGSHLRIMREISQTINQINFNGVIFVVTNPVDFLTYSLYANSQQNSHALRTFQLYGIGLELDAMRALYHSRQMGVQLNKENIRLFGNHSDTLHLETPLSGTENQTLLSLIKSSSKEIREYIPRTIYGPASAAKKTLDAYWKAGSIHVTLIQDGSHIGRLINFKNHLPKLANEPENIAEYNQIIEFNRQNIEQLDIK